MKIKNLLFVLITISFLSFPAFAETGSITVSNSLNFLGYTPGAGGTLGDTFMWDTFNFDITDYNTISSFYVITDTDTVYKLVSNSTYFTCKSGCTGNGFVMYNKLGKIIDWEFASGFKVTAHPFNVTYEINIFDSNNFDMTPATESGNNGAITSSHPMFIRTAGARQAEKLKDAVTSIASYNVVIGTSTTNFYNFTYPIPNNFQGKVTKGNIATRVKVESQSSSYFDEGSTTLNNITMGDVLTNGIYLNISLTLGNYTKKLINSSGVSLPPGGAGTNPTNITKPSTGGIVGFDKSSYFVGDNVNISWYFSDDTWNNFNGKRLYLLLNGNPISESIGCGSIDCIEISTQSGYYIFQATQLGTLQAILREGIFFYSDVQGGSASVQILPPGNSWIALNQTIAFAKNPVNVTYHIGYSVASYPAAVIEIDTIDIATGNTVDTVFPTVFPDGVINIGVIHPLPKGNYSIKLYDAVKNVYLDTKYLTMIVPNVQIPTQGITVSNISTDKTLYFYNDWMTVNFAVDDTNFSNYNYTLMMHVIALDRSGIVTKMIISPMQDQVGTFTTLINIDKNTKCEQKLNCWFETGNNSINIVLMNSTASVTIAYANFTVSSTTVDGYGLQLSTTTPQSNTQFTITTTVPTLHTGRLRIVTTGSGNISAIPDQTVNAGISTLPATISIVNNFDKAYYNVELYGDDGILKVRIPITVTQQIKPLTTSEINAMDKIDSWTALFGLGVNPTSKFIFGMIITLLIAACGVILVKNDRFIGAALFGAIPFLFFSYISYFPIVVPVIVGIIIALKFRFL